MSGWSVAALGRLVGVTPATLGQWVRLGLVTPEELGRGRAGHVIGLGGLLEVLAVVELRNAGFETRQIRRAVANLREFSGQQRPLGRLVVLVVGNDIIWGDQETALKQISLLRKPGQRVMLLHVGEQYEHLQERLAREEGRVPCAAAV